MSITIYIRTPSEVHEIEADGNETLKILYERAAEVAGVEVKNIILQYEGEELPSSNTEQVQSTTLTEGCEIDLMLSCLTVNVTITDLWAQREAINALMKENPALILHIDASTMRGGDGTLKLAGRHLPEHARHVKITDPLCRVAHIKDGFLHHSTIATLDLTDLKNLTTIGGHFLYNSECLVGVEFPENPSVVEIGDGFLLGCSLLETVQLGCLESIPRVPEEFLSLCRNLIHVDVSHLKYATRLGKRFMSGCSSLTSLELSTNVIKNIGDDFLKGCCALKSLDLSRLNEVSCLGSDFLSGTSLQSVDVSSFPNLVSVGDGFLSFMPCLKEVNASSPDSKIRKIGKDMCNGCGVMTSADFSKLQVTEVGCFFLHMCTGLLKAQLPRFLPGSEVPDDFLTSCTSLVAVDLSPLRPVVSIGHRFFAKTPLRVIDLVPLSSVRSIGDGFLLDNDSLCCVNLEPLKKLRLVGGGFLEGCVRLAVLKRPKKLKYIGESALSGTSVPCSERDALRAKTCCIA